MGVGDDGDDLFGLASSTHIAVAVALPRGLHQVVVRAERVRHDLILDVASVAGDGFLLAVAEQVVAVLNLLLRLLGPRRLDRVVLPQVRGRVRGLLRCLRVAHLVADDIHAIIGTVRADAMFVGWDARSTI